MKRLLSLFLALALMLSFAGCRIENTIDINNDIHLQATEPSTTVPETTQATEPEETQAPTEVEETEYPVPPETRPEDTLPPQTDPPRTEPPVTEPAVTEPSLPPQTDPDRPGWDEQETEPPTEPTTAAPTEAPTDPPTTLPPQTDPPKTEPPTESRLDPNGSYTYKDDVALFIVTYGRLPNNFVTKRQANNYSGELCDHGLCIGGDRFYNREGLLPSGYTYYECDIGTLYSTSRGAKRLVFTYSGIVYYTSDHYKSFTLLYGNP